MKCRSIYGYHTPEKVDEIKYRNGTTDEKHRCYDCGNEWEFRKLPDGQYYNEKEYYTAYAKDFLQPHHADYELIYGDPQEIVDQHDQQIKRNKHLKESKQELDEFKKSIGKMKFAV